MTSPSPDQVDGQVHRSAGGPLAFPPRPSPWGHPWAELRRCSCPRGWTSYREGRGRRIVQNLLETTPERPLLKSEPLAMGIKGDSAVGVGPIGPRATCTWFPTSLKFKSHALHSLSGVSPLSTAGLVGWWVGRHPVRAAARCAAQEHARSCFSGKFLRKRVGTCSKLATCAPPVLSLRASPRDETTGDGHFECRWLC